MKLRRKTVITLVIVALVLVAAIDFFHVSGSELSLADLASDEAIITVEKDYKASGKIIETYSFTKGQGVALQSLLLRTHYLRSFTDLLRLDAVENSPYRIFIHIPEPARDFSFSLSKSTDGWYLGGSETGGWLKILDPDWATAFQGILAADQ